MISSTCNVASRLAITGILSVYFFRETVIRPQVLSGRDRKVSTGRIVVSTCISTFILVLAAHRTASKFLSGEIGAPSTGETLTDTDCSACKRHQDTPNRRPLVNSALLAPVRSPFLLFQPISSSPVLDSTPCNIIMINLLTSSSPVFKSTTPCSVDTIDLPTSSSPVLPPQSTPCHITTTIDLPATSTPVLESTTPCHITIVDLPTPSSPVLESTTPCDITIIDLPTSSSPVLPSMPSDITIVDLPNLANCNRLSFTSDATLVACGDEDDSEDSFADNTSNTKEAESSADQRTFHEAKEREPARAAQSQDDYAATTNPINNPPSRQPNLRRLALVDKTTSTITNPALLESAHPANANPSLTGSARPSNANVSLTGSAHPANANAPLIGSAHPINVLGQKIKAAASWLEPLILVTKHAAGRLIPPPPTALRYQPEKSRPHNLKQHKRKHRASRSNAACDSIVRSRLRRHANRIVGHLAQVCEQIRVDQAVLMDGWVAAMAEVGLTSILAGNHRTSPESPLPPIADAVLVLEPGSRIKARIASLRQRTNAVAAAIPATTTTIASGTHFLTPPTSYARLSQLHYSLQRPRTTPQQQHTTYDSPPCSRATSRRAEYDAVKKSSFHDTYATTLSNSATSRHSRQTTKNATTLSDADHFTTLTTDVNHHCTTS